MLRNGLPQLATSIVQGSVSAGVTLAGRTPIRPPLHNNDHSFFADAWAGTDKESIDWRKRPCSGDPKSRFILMTAVKGAPGPAPGGGEGGLNAAASARRGAEAGEGGMVVAGGGFEPPTFGL